MNCIDHVILLGIKRAESFNYQPLIKREVMYFSVCFASRNAYPTKLNYQPGLLLHCWWPVVVPATQVVLPGTIGLSLKDVQAFAVERSCLAALLRRQG